MADINVPRDANDIERALDRLEDLCPACQPIVADVLRALRPVMAFVAGHRQDGA